MTRDVSADQGISNLLSLFCGCGGLDAGFEEAGFKTDLAYDRRTQSVRSWRRNFGDRAHVRDIWDLTLDDLDADHGSRFTPVGVIGGPPCQGFSKANRGASADDPRNALVARFFDLALQLHARSGLQFIVMENVAEILGVRGGGIVDLQIDRLEAAGFNVSTIVLNAQDYDVPQSRRRMFLVAVNPAHSKTPWSAPSPSKSRLNVRDAISHLSEPAYWSRQLANSEKPEHPNHWCMAPKSKKFFSGELVEGSAASRSFKTLAWDRPSYTVAYGNREVHIHPNCHRRLSVYEAMLLQGFPDSFELLGSLSDQIKQVSEAVPPPLAKAIGLSVKAALQGQTYSVAP